MSETTNIHTHTHTRVHIQRGCAGVPVVFNSQTQISDAASAVLLDEDVLALQVSVSDGWFALRTIDLSMEVAQTTCCRVGQLQQSLSVQGGELQVVVQRAVLMVVGDEEELREGSGALNVSCNKTWRKQRKAGP